MRRTIIGILVAVSVVVSAGQAEAELWITMGNVFCHGESAGPQYFHSHLAEVTVNPRREEDDWLMSRGLDREGALEGRTLRDLAAAFARYVAEQHGVEALLSPRCTLTRPGSGHEEMHSAAYALEGEIVRYEESEKTRVNWLPNFQQLLQWNLQWKAVAQPVRVALVIGNGAYEEGAVTFLSPRNDAEDMGAALERLGFDTTVLVDVDANAMVDGLRAFALRAQSADIALVFYSGLGAEVNGDGFLFPIDADLDGTGESPVSSVAVDTVIAGGSGAEVSIVILDASRDTSVFRQVEGLAGRVAEGAQLAESALWRSDVPRDDPGNVLIAYATTAEGLASESLRNGLYTEALLGHLEDPDAEIREMFRRVAARVVESSNGTQRPALYSTETRAIRLVVPEPPPAGGPVPVR